MKTFLSILFFSLSTNLLFSQFCSVPTTQCYNVTLSNQTTNSIKVTWSKGTGDYSLVVLKPAVSGTVAPTNANMDTYIASSNYASGTNLGSNNFIVYMGTGTSVTVSGIASCYNFHALVYSYEKVFNSFLGEYVYCLKNTYGTGNTDEQYTLATEPTTAPTMSLIGTPGITTATLATTGTGSSWSLISVRPSSYSGVAPSDGILYTASSSYGAGAQIGGVTNNYATYFSSATGTLNLSNLQQATGYYARVYAANGSGSSSNNCYNYYTGSYKEVYFSTYNYAPVMNTVTNMTLCQNAPTQTVNLSGIGDGSAAENQTLYVYAGSSNTSLIQNVTVNYTSPNSTGNLVFTPTAGQYGTCIIYVSLYDSGPNNYYTDKSFTVTVLPQPGNAAAITTSNTVICQQKNGVVFTTPAISNATGYNWTVPTGGTITAGNNTNSITVNFNSSLTSGQVSVYGTNSNGCGNGSTSSLNVTFDKMPTASAAGPNQNICNNLTPLAANTPVIGSGAWTYCSSGLGNISSTVTPNANLSVANNQTVTSVWTVTNGVCPASSSTVVVTNIFGSPSCNPDADFVSNKTTVCVGAPVIFYNSSIGATSYTWNFGATATPSVSNASNSVSVVYSSAGAKTPTLSITTTASLTNVEVKSNYIDVITAPTAPTNITGNTTVCQGKAAEPYFVNTVVNATDYTWSFPAGVSQNTGSNTNAITANFSTTATSGNVGVSASNSCGSSSITTLSITVNPLPTTASAITGSATVCQGVNGVVYIATNINNGLSYTWTTPTGASIVGGLNTPTVTLNYNNSAVSGNISVYATNGCGDGGTTVKTITVNPLPGVATNVDGSSMNTMCPLSSNLSYTTAPVSNATSYAWLYPSGYSVVGASNTNTLILNASLNSVNGNIKVVGLNACGHGDTSNVLNVNIEALPTQELCVVTVDSLSTSNEIIWQKNQADNNVDSFRVYRVQTVTIDTLIATVSYNDLSRAVDVTANPNVTSYTYKIAAVDTCGNEGPKSLAHQSIHLQSIYSPSPQKMDLMWNLYVGATVSNYRVLRDTNNSGNWIVLANNLAPNATSFTDFGIPAGALSVQYRVDVVWSQSCDYAAKLAQSVINTTKSNTKDFVIVSPNSVQEQQDLLNSVSIYPNPTNDQFQVSLKAAVDNVEVKVMDQLGALVKTVEMNYEDNKLINISGLANGIYFVTIKTSFGSVTKRITKL